MKRLFGLLLSLAGTIMALSTAQNIEYEVIRTQETPGYFALRVYPGNQLPPLEVQTVFVENYTSRAERRRYSQLAQAIRNSGTLVLSAKQAVGYVDEDRFRLVLLGGPAQHRWLQFRAPLGADVIPAFEEYSQVKLGPVYLMNLQADFGGNITQVRPEEQPFLNDEATYFVGQFDRPMKTRVSLSGETDELVVQADGILDLETYRPHEANGVLKDLWNDLDAKGDLKAISFRKIVIDSFPFLLLMLGLGIMYLASRPSKLRTGMMEEIDDEFWHTPIEETPLYQAWEQGFDWELSDEALKKFKT